MLTRAQPMSATCADFGNFFNLHKRINARARVLRNAGQELTTTITCVDHGGFFERADFVDVKRLREKGAIKAHHSAPMRHRLLNAEDDPLRTFAFRNAANELHRDPRRGPAQRLFHRENECTVSWTDTYAIKGVVVACSEHRRVEDEEGRTYQETWFDAKGNKHRDRGPAVVYENVHYIREETYLDEARQEFWKH